MNKFGDLLVEHKNDIIVFFDELEGDLKNSFIINDIAKNSIINQNLRYCLGDNYKKDFIEHNMEKISMIEKFILENKLQKKLQVIRDYLMMVIHLTTSDLALTNKAAAIITRRFQQVNRNIHREDCFETRLAMSRIVHIISHYMVSKKLKEELNRGV